MANFTRTDDPSRTRFLITIGSAPGDVDVDVWLKMSDGHDKVVTDLTRAEIVAGTTGAQRTATRAFLDAVRALAVAKAGGT